MPWKPGDRLIHRDNPTLGPGVVLQVEGRTVVVIFPQSDATLRLAGASPALRPLEIPIGCRAHIGADPTEVIVESFPEEGQARLSDGRVVELGDVWPLDVGDSLVDRLAQGDVSRVNSFALRLDAFHLATLREADGLGTFLGGRIRLFPHQLYVAERATRADPVRWLLADEVGLGKTVEACLILNHLVRTGRAERTLVVAPETLTVQWLGELWRKYHQVFVLLDDKRLADVERDYGEGFNPFEVYRQVVVGLDYLRDRPFLTERAVEAGIDLLIVDEAHHLRRPQMHPGNREYRAIAPIAALNRHTLLLTATPLEEDAHGFFRLLQLLRPDEFPETDDFATRLERREPLPPCTSATRREEIGGLPPRQPHPIDLPVEGWADMLALETSVRAEAAAHTVAQREKLRRIRRALASGPSLEALLREKDGAVRKLARRAARTDPRLEWLAEHAPLWKREGDKTLIFVAQRESLEWIREALSRRVQLRTGVFHEELSASQRDIEVAQFRGESGPSILVSTECGGEGRNFEFCTRLVLFDLPWNPMTVEQRIGRLDRIGRDRDVEIHYFRQPSGVGAAVVGLYEEIGLFERPLGGVERELAAIEAAIEELALSVEANPDRNAFRGTITEARQAWDRIQEAAYHELHREPYRPEMAAAILARVPENLAELTEDVILATAEKLRLRVEDHRGSTRYSIELDHHARVESLPGVPPGSSFLGTFDRESAVADEALDFFASGHPLVEGVLAWLDDASTGRVALLHVSGGAEPGFGLLALYRSRSGFEAVAVDPEGRRRPEWAELLTRRPLRSRRIKAETWTARPEWPGLIRSLAGHLDPERRPDALAAFRIG